MSWLFWNLQASLQLTDVLLPLPHPPPVLDLKECMFSACVCLVACVHNPASLMECCPFLRSSSFLFKQVL